MCVGGDGVDFGGSGVEPKFPEAAPAARAISAAANRTGMTPIKNLGPCFHNILP